MSQSSPATIEIFPAELFFELSKYFEGIEFFKIFKNLNRRINSILRQTPLHLKITDVDVYNQYVKENILSFINLESIQSLHVKPDDGHVTIFEEFSLSSFTCLRSLMIDIEVIPFHVIDQIQTLKHLQWLSIRSFTLNENHNKTFNHFLNSLFMHGSSVNPLRSNLKTLKLLAKVPSNIFSTVHRNAGTQIQKMIFDGLINSTEFIRMLSSLACVRSLKVYWYTPDSITTIKPTFQLHYCTKLHIGFVHYSIETPARNTLMILLPCFPNIKKLIIDLWKQLDIVIIIDELLSVVMKHRNKLKLFELFCSSDYISHDELRERCMNIFGQSELTEIVRGERACYNYNHIKVIRLN